MMMFFVGALLALAYIALSSRKPRVVEPPSRLAPAVRVELDDGPEWWESRFQQLLAETNPSPGQKGNAA